MKMILVMAFLALPSLSVFAGTIVCTQGDRPISVEIDYQAGRAISKMTVINYGEMIYSGNAKITKKPTVNDGETVFASTVKAEGNFTNGDLPAWILTLNGNGHGNLEVLSDRLQKKLSMFETNETLYCK